MLHTKDTDSQSICADCIDVVVAIAIAFFRQLGFSKLWLVFVTGKDYNLGPFNSDALILFHVFSRCDTTSLVVRKK